MSRDPSNGYDAIADQFISVRSDAGHQIVSDWAKSLQQKASVIDIGAGPGEPITSALVENYCTVWALDASPTMVDAFKARFPDIEIACEAAEQSSFFDRTFDGAIAIGLMFLLAETAQRDLIESISKALKPGGRFLFSAPVETGTWEDTLTGNLSRSLGLAAYKRALMDAGFHLMDQFVDEGGSNYYSTQKR